MPNSPQAKKRLRQADRRRQLNRATASRMKTEMKKVITAAESGDVETALSLLPEATRRIDKAAKKNVIHSNNAARKKSRLARAIKIAEQSSGSS